MDHQYAARGAAAAQRAREQMSRMGRTPRGHLLWTAKEDEVIRQHYPDTRAICKLQDQCRQPRGTGGFPFIANVHSAFLLPRDLGYRDARTTQAQPLVPEGAAMGGTRAAPSLSFCREGVWLPVCPRLPASLRFLLAQPSVLQAGASS